VSLTRDYSGRYRHPGSARVVDFGKIPWTSAWNAERTPSPSRCPPWYGPTGYQSINRWERERRRQLCV